ncbi:MAG: PrgI family protein [Candidatus Saccharimonadales bacterium]
MKIAIVPAQVTSIEDKVAGNLSLTQLILIALPIFISGVIYAALPPTFAIGVYKVIVMLIIIVSFGVLAIRVRGTLILDWAQLLARYNMRPRYYVFNKNDKTLRPILIKRNQEKNLDKPKEINIPSPPLHISTTAERIGFEQLIHGGTKKIVYKRSRKGSLYVSVSKND